MRRSTIVTVGVLAALAAFLLYATLASQKYECTVAVTFNGRSNVATASAESRKDAARQAQTTACGIIASGMSESIACDNTPPDTTECRTL
jgi:peroxiredoxin family protein